MASVTSTVNINIRTRKTGTGAKQVSNDLREITNTSRLASVAQYALWSAVVAGAVGAVVAVGSFISESTKAFAEFDHGVREIWSLLPNASEDSMLAMRDDVITLSKEMGILTEDVVPALYQAISAGVPEESAMEFMRIASRAAIAGVTDLETAVDGLTNVWNAYGHENITVTEISDIMFAAIRGGKVTFETLTAAMSTVVPVAAALGVDFNEVAAAIEVMASQGADTSTSATNLRRFLIEITKEGSKAREVFDHLAGETFVEFIANGHTVAEAMELMRDYADDNNIAVTDMFGRIQAGQAVLLLTGENLDNFKNEIILTGDAAGDTNQAFEKINESLLRQGELFQAQKEAASLMVGGLFAPLKVAALDFGTWFFNAIEDAAHALVILGDTSQYTRVQLIGMLEGIQEVSTYDAVGNFRVLNAAAAELAVAYESINNAASAGLLGQGSFFNPFEAMQPEIMKLVELFALSSTSAEEFYYALQAAFGQELTNEIVGFTENMYGLDGGFQQYYDNLRDTGVEMREFNAAQIELNKQLEIEGSVMGETTTLQAQYINGKWEFVEVTRAQTSAGTELTEAEIARMEAEVERQRLAQQAHDDMMSDLADEKDRRLRMVVDEEYAARVEERIRLKLLEDLAEMEEEEEELAETRRRLALEHLTYLEEVARQDELALARMQERADDSWGFLQDQIDMYDRMASAQQKSRDILSEINDEMSAEEIEEVYFRAGEAANSWQERLVPLEQQLFNVVMANKSLMDPGGNPTEAMLEMAVATGVLSDAQAAAALKVITMKLAIEDIGRMIDSGQITWEQGIDLVQRLGDGSANTADEALYLAAKERQVGDDSVYMQEKLTPLLGEDGILSNVTQAMYEAFYETDQFAKALAAIPEVTTVTLLFKNVIDETAIVDPPPDGNGGGGDGSGTVPDPPSSDDYPNPDDAGGGSRRSSGGGRRGSNVTNIYIDGTGQEPGQVAGAVADLIGVNG